MKKNSVLIICSFLHFNQWYHGYVGLLSALSDLEKENFSFSDRSKRDVFYEAVRYLNILGGTVILDMLSPEEIQAKVINHLKTLNN